MLLGSTPGIRQYCTDPNHLLYRAVRGRGEGGGGRSEEGGVRREEGEGRRERNWGEGEKKER